jgi:UDP-N-acetylmuramoyl-tripeptide--D-alanyl-D-alanine ligase
MDALLALAAGNALGVSLSEGAKHLEKFAPLPGRMQEKRTPEGALLLLDHYNSNPLSLQGAFQWCTEVWKNEASLAGGGPGNLLAVLGDMLELGSHAEEAHRGLGGRLGVLPVDVFIAVGPMMGLALEEFKNAGAGRLAIACEDSARAAAELMANLRPGDTVLIKGSRGMKMEKVLPEERKADAL